jgi:hypothetical protein
MNTKYCKRCDRELPLSEFHKDRSLKDGLAFYCRECTAKYGHAYVMKTYKNPYYIYKQLKAVNKSKNRKKVHISENDFVEWYNNEPKVCAYCDIPEDKLMVLPEHYKMNRARLAVDCKTNNLEYRKGNIVLACGRCNSVKGDIFNYETFREIAQKYIKPLWIQLINE